MSEAKLNLPPELQRILKYWRLIISLLFLVVVLWVSIFQISTEEVGVITRFGKYVKQCSGLACYYISLHISATNSNFSISITDLRSPGTYLAHGDIPTPF